MTSAASSWILSVIRQNPLLFNSVTGGVLCAGSDAMAQQLEQQPRGQDDIYNNKSSQYPLDSLLMASSPIVLSPIDWIRCGSAGMIGMFFGGIVYPRAYAKLDSIWVGKDFLTVLQKSLVEIATVGIFVNSLSMTSRGFCKRIHGSDDNDDKSSSLQASQIMAHVREELPTVTRNDFVVWLPYNLVAFSFIPAVIRPTTTAFMEASWQTYISLRSHDYKEHKKTTPTATVLQ